MPTRRGRASVACLVVALAAALGTVSPTAAAAQGPCPNADMRKGPSAALPDCRAYELVTPSETGSATISFEIFTPTQGRGFASRFISPDGGAAAYMTGAGALPGFEANGINDLYRASRTAEGWLSELISPTGSQSEYPTFDGLAPGLSHPFFTTSGLDRGPLSLGGTEPTYLGLPDGTFEHVGVGSLGTDPDAEVHWASPGAEHVIFRSDMQLEPEAPASGDAIYDRTPGGATKVVSLLPGGVTPTSAPVYRGASADGSAVVFTADQRRHTQDGMERLYARIDNTTTKVPANGLPLGATIPCTGGPSSAATLEYQWLRDGATIAGATSPTYETAPADAGAVIQCQVTARNANAGTLQVSRNEAAVAPMSTTRPPTTGSFALSAPMPASPTAGTVLTCNGSEGGWAGAPTAFDYQWYVNGIAVPGESGTSYEVQPGDVPGAIQCSVTASNAGGATVRISSARVTSPAPSPAAPTASAATPAMGPQLGAVSGDGSRVHYVQAGNVFAYHSATETTTPVAPTGDAEVVNIAADGSRVYFISKRQLDGGEGTAGDPNLYVSDGSTIRFVATVLPVDASDSIFGIRVGLATWLINNANPSPRQISGPGGNPSRTTHDGSVLVFESRANLTGYDSGGHSQVYRYDAVADQLACVSCPPGPATGAAQLQQGRPLPSGGRPIPFSMVVDNVAADGDTVAFETMDGLVPGDTDGLKDIYRWRAGVGGAPADVALISYGRSDHVKTPDLLGGFPLMTDFLLGLSADGGDIFFVTPDPLLAEAGDGGVSAVYDARVGGGFASSQDVAECQGDGCQESPTAVPGASPPATRGYRGAGNVADGRDRVGRRSCARLGQRATRLARAGRRLRRRANRVERPVRRHRLRRKANRTTRRAKVLRRKQRVCARNARRDR